MQKSVSQTEQSHQSPPNEQTLDDSLYMSKLARWFGEAYNWCIYTIFCLLFETLTFFITLASRYEAGKYDNVATALWLLFWTTISNVILIPWYAGILIHYFCHGRRSEYRDGKPNPWRPEPMPKWARKVGELFNGYITVTFLVFWLGIIAAQIVGFGDSDTEGATFITFGAAVFPHGITPPLMWVDTVLTFHPLEEVHFGWKGEVFLSFCEQAILLYFYLALMIITGNCDLLRLEDGNPWFPYPFFTWDWRAQFGIYIAFGVFQIATLYLFEFLHRHIDKRYFADSPLSLEASSSHEEYVAEPELLT